MRLARRHLLQLGAALVALPWQQATAQSYPSRPLRWVVGFPPGGAADIVARIVTQPLAERLGQPMIIDNKPGGASNIAAQTVVTAPPDGYTLFLASTSNAINASLYQSLPFDFPRDLAPVAGVSAQPLVMVVNPTLPADSVASFIAHAKTNPGRINMASFGTGTISHLAGELFKSMAGVEMVHVPYRGGAAMVADLLGGQVQVAFDVLASSLPHVRRNALRCLAVTSATRSEALPDVPTIGDTVTGYAVSGWLGIAAPRDTPEAVIARLNQEINAVLATSAIKARLADAGSTPLLQSAAEFGRLMITDTARWAQVVRSSGAKPE